MLLQDTFDICRKTFSSGEEMVRMSLSDKVDLFFHDYSLVPLFAFENYIGAIPFSSRSETFVVVFCFYNNSAFNRLELCVIFTVH